ncbi:MAG: hypothetical protein LQ344_006563 [Seirophora lacunosa]|nr:MAG: hypothetical protein LQ344_006563 [Seirophora lacunosa]
MSLSAAGGSAPTATARSDLEGHLNAFSHRLPPQDAAEAAEVIEGKVEAGHAIRQMLLDSPGSRDIFRHLTGFEKLFSTFDLIITTSRHDQESHTSAQSCIDLLRVSFSILAAALANHGGNRMYFRDRIPGGGWHSLYLKLDALRQSNLNDRQEGHSMLEQNLYGCLFACAMDDETILELFKTAMPQQSDNQATSSNLEAEEKSSVKSDAQVHPKDMNEDYMTERFLKKTLGPTPSLQNPEALCVAIRLWRSWYDFAQNGDNYRDAFVVKAVSYLARSSTHNLVDLRHTDLLSILLASLGDTMLAGRHVSKVRDLAALLLSLGITKLDHAHLLYRNARTSSLVAGLLSDALNSSQSPSYFHFDLSICGYSSIELPDLGQFPPAGSSKGYTLSLWLQISKFDQNAHTTLFGAFDGSQTCFVLVYLEKDSRNLILQTSVTSSRPSVRFKSVSFREDRWYHIAIAHQRPKTTSSSRVSLFVNGSFVEQLKANYPLTAPVHKSGNMDHRLNPVQAFVGTPQDLASRLGRDAVCSQWRLASAYIFGDVLSDDLVAVYYELGPRYFGNYQDCLGSFNTYHAAASLKIRNDSLYPGKEQRSDIIRAMEVGGSELLSETKLILGLSPENVHTASNFGLPDKVSATRYISESAVRSTRYLGSKYGSLVINSALPMINDALKHPHGYGVLTGGPAIVTILSLDNAAWQIGGSTAVVLNLLDGAHSEDAVIQTLKCIFGTIRNNWRCSEAMERENGFAILSNLIADKVNGGGLKKEGNEKHQSSSQAYTEASRKFALDILALVLKFLGYRTDKPEQSVLNNPLAYRILLVDADFWRTQPVDVQGLYYAQFLAFGVHSIVKKWLEALKTEPFKISTFKQFLEAFQAMLALNMTGDCLRSCAMYITYALEKARNEEQQLEVQSSAGSTGKTPIQIRDAETMSNAPYREAGADPEVSPAQRASRILKLYADTVCLPSDAGNTLKFAKTVTNKWLLNLLVSDNAEVVTQVMRILARLLVISGHNYVKRFSEETGGLVIMQHRLKHWYHITAVWRACFAILFGRDVALVDFARPFSLFSLVDEYIIDGRDQTLHPEILPVLVAMMQNGLKVFNRSNTKSRASLETADNERSTTPQATDSSNSGKGASLDDPNDVAVVDIMKIVTRFLADVHSRSPEFRDLVVVSTYVQELISTLYPVVVGLEALDPVTELQARESLVTSEKQEVFVRPLSRSSTKSAYVIRTLDTETAATGLKPRMPVLRRVSSYVLVKSDSQNFQPSPAKLQLPLSTEYQSSEKEAIDQTVVEEILEMVIAVYSDQILIRKDFPGLGLFMKVPPGIQEHQAFFESFILRNTVIHVGNSIRLDQRILLEPRVLANLQRLAGHLGEAVFEGWFIDGAETVLEFLGSILEYLQMPETQHAKSIRLCSHIIATIREVLLRVVLLRLSELDERSHVSDIVAFMKRLVYWQAVLLAMDDSQKHFLRLFCFLLYTKMTSEHDQVRACAADVWRLLLVHKPEDTSQILRRAALGQHDELLTGFSRLTEADNETFLAWADENQRSLNSMFFDSLSKAWTDFVTEENRNTEEVAKVRIVKRKDKLRQWASQALRREEIIHRHEISCDHWRANIYSSESIKKQRAAQDQQTSLAFNQSSWNKLQRALHRPCGLLESPDPLKWQLDLTEGRNRMRLRTIIDSNSQFHDYRSKRELSRGPSQHQHRRGTAYSRRKTVGKATPPVPAMPNAHAKVSDRTQASTKHAISDETEKDQGEDEDDYEMVGDPHEDGNNYEDKNRKVLRSLHRGDQVEHVHNVSRIIGLEGLEGLLIIGKLHLYLLDGLFQRSDGEIVSVSQAPQDERDNYLQMISGRDPGERLAVSGNVEQEVRSWRRDEVLSISKRRFLFRDVALEVFFEDGRSYLLTTNATSFRDDLYQKLVNKTAPVAARRPSVAEDVSWRFDSVQDPAEQPQSLGSRFTSVFAQNSSTPATRKWLQGEMSNFNYLMHVNTIAGRTFNDLTQYPVFPWVLADYTSDELDLSDPRSFRDLTKPMGCQTPERQADFRDRYQSFAEMGDHNAPPFHYGTHYSTAMIVTSYLIRLQPFVQSYLLLQGGSFDHPDRLFYSVEKTWASASRGNMTDVRELIPEFFYLPEFLLNTNGFDFGQRQGAGETIDTVSLPPWAKGDPKIFIAKNREALESGYVSKHLHHWIDLIFGHKQQGEAALEATNVFHHLSYRGAKDLDKIEDPLERLATIGIIHNFGQTPHQVFQRSHPARDDGKNIPKQIDTVAESLTRLPSAVFNIRDRVTSLQYSTKLDQLICSAPSKVNIGPSYDKYLEWGYTDGGIRFYASDTKKLIGLFEHVHVTQISCVLFADSQTLVTAGDDGVVSVWGVSYPSRSAVDLQPKGSLFGHRAPVTVLAASRSFRTLLSADERGQVLLWDLNRLEILRRLATEGPSQLVTCARIHDVNGRVIVCRGPNLALFTLNGDPILEQNVCTEEDAAVASCAFYEGSGNDWLRRELVFTGHRRGVVNIWNVAIRRGAFVLEHIKRMHHLDPAATAARTLKSSITCVLPLAQRVYTGDEDGKVYEWQCVQRQ